MRLKFRMDEMETHITCVCGAVFEIYEDDGVPGCRDVERVYCPYCGHEVARQFGTCEGRVVDDDNVCDELKEIHTRYNKIIAAYAETHDRYWETDEYNRIFEQRQVEIAAVMERQNKNVAGDTPQTHQQNP